MAIERLLPPQAWPSAVIDTPKRCHQRLRFVDEAIRLTGYDGRIRQLAVDGLGREQPTLFLSTVRTDSASLTFYRQRVAYCLSSRTDSASLNTTLSPEPWLVL
ncbi:MAG TPA: hypothetical protein VKP69_01540, partial [Isosphaeraceae bacterium]|nr:hypothetical protein [Isosphaeraceae bacterium]